MSESREEQEEVEYDIPKLLTEYCDYLRTDYDPFREERQLIDIVRRGGVLPPDLPLHLQQLARLIEEQEDE